ncbi:MAG: hypothetical protein RI965_345 [Bacteroidota bacterium]|jgi:chromosome segregation ATPase
MPITAYDEFGKEIPELYTSDEAKALQTELEETKQKLTKLENKDFNFRRLEQMTEEEKSKLSATEIALKQKQEQIEEEQKKFVESMVGERKNDIFNELAGGDEELLKKLEANFSRIKDSDNAKTASEIRAVAQEAFLLATGGRIRTNSFSSAVNVSGNSPSVSSKTSKISDELAGLASNLGISEDDFKKYSK